MFGTDNLMENLLTFVRPNFGGKVIFAGDPAQLPPVGESISNVLRAEYFSPKIKKSQRKYTFLLNICPIFKEKYYLCSCLKINKYEYHYH